MFRSPLGVTGCGGPQPWKSTRLRFEGDVVPTADPVRSGRWPWLYTNPWGPMFEIRAAAATPGDQGGAPPVTRSPAVSCLLPPVRDRGFASRGEADDCSLTPARGQTKLAPSF